MLANMAASNITVVRTWGFNDVTAVPTDGSPWLQLLAANGTTVINNGTDGLQRLDRFIDLAAQNGIHVIFSLTNNWNPVVGDTLNGGGQPSRRDVPAPSATRPRNFLSNDYGTRVILPVTLDAYGKLNPRLAQVAWMHMFAHSGRPSCASFCDTLLASSRPRVDTRLCVQAQRVLHRHDHPGRIPELHPGCGRTLLFQSVGACLGASQ